MSAFNSSISDSAKAFTVGYFRKRADVTWLTRLSVHCAERMVETSSSWGCRKTSEQWESGYSFESLENIIFARDSNLLFNHHLLEPNIIKNDNSCFINFKKRDI
jgi:hypothetical protein